jgi:predicted small metal-binding protein
MEERKVIACHEFGFDCSLRISGDADEVVLAAAQHSVDRHGAIPGQGLESTIRSLLKDEEGPSRAAEAGTPGGAVLH